MIDNYQPRRAKILSIENSSIDSKLIKLQFLNKAAQKKYDFNHGQFMMAGIAGFGEAPFDICSNPYEKKRYFEISVRNVGELTAKIHHLKKGGILQVRGPFGNGFPSFGISNLLLIGGGCGAVTLRSFLLEYCDHRYERSHSVQVFWGSANESTILFGGDHPDWRKKADLNIILEKGGKKWPGPRGLVTELIKKKKIVDEPKVILCGPPIMYRFAIKELLLRGIKEDNIYLSLERRMYCGVGICQHCALGPYYVCKDGPVFCYKQIKIIPNAI